MTCKEAESMIMPYINDELTDKELETFLDHIYGCSACHEELEIYYTLYAGLAQLDEKTRGRTCTTFWKKLFTRLRSG